jgi:hypothetical protein
MRELFSPTEGIGLNYLRQPIGPTDFVATLPYATYEAAGIFDPSHDERSVLPLLRAAAQHQRRRAPHGNALDGSGVDEGQRTRARGPTGGRTPMRRTPTSS